MDIVVFICFLVIFLYHLINRRLESLGFIIFFQEIILLFFQKNGFTSFANISLMIFAILFSVFNLKEFNKEVIKKKVFSGFFIVFFLFILSFVFQILYRGFFSEETYTLFFRFFTQVLPIIIFIVVFYNDHTKLNQILNGVLIYGLFFYLMLFFTYDLSGLSNLERKYFRDEVGISPIQLSRLSGFIFISAFFFILSQRRLFLKAVGFILILISIYFLILGGSRGPFIFLFLTFLIVYFIKYGLNTKLIRLILLSFILIFLIFISFPEFSNFLLRFNEFQDYDSMLRYKRIEFFLQNFLNFSIFIFGLGPGGFNYVSSLSYPHNIFLELYIEYGIFGILLFSSMIIIIFKGYRLFSKGYDDVNFICLFAIFIYFLLSSLVSGDIIGNRALFFLFFIFLSYLYSLKSYFFVKRISP